MSLFTLYDVFVSLNLFFSLALRRRHCAAKQTDNFAHMGQATRASPEQSDVNVSVAVVTVSSSQE